MGKLDQEEKALLDDYESGKLKPVKNRKGEFARHRKAADASVKKDARIKRYLVEDSDS